MIEHPRARRSEWRVFSRLVIVSIASPTSLRQGRCLRSFSARIVRISPKQFSAGPTPSWCSRRWCRLRRRRDRDTGRPFELTGVDGQGARTLACVWNLGTRRRDASIQGRRRLRGRRGEWPSYGVKLTRADRRVDDSQGRVLPTSVTVRPGFGGGGFEEREVSAGARCRCDDPLLDRQIRRRPAGVSEGRRGRLQEGEKGAFYSARIEARDDRSRSGRPRFDLVPGGGGRTLTPRRERDFESRASASFTTPAQGNAFSINAPVRRSVP